MDWLYILVATSFSGSGSQQFSKNVFLLSTSAVHGSLSAQFFFTIGKCHMWSPNDKRSVEIFHHSSGYISRNTYRYHFWRKGMVRCGILRAYERGVSRCFGSKAHRECDICRT